MLKLSKQGEKVLHFVKQNTKNFDYSHDWKHAYRVAQRAVQIQDNITSLREPVLSSHQSTRYNDVIFLSLLHDVCDHKYKNDSIARKDLTDWIEKNLSEYKYIDKLIDKVSFSYQVKNPDEKVPKILEIVRDADRFDSLGQIGIIRLETYSKKIGRGREDAIKHCFDKILKLVPEGYIVNLDEETIHKHNIIVDYVNRNGNYKIPKYKK
jgi:uncharacterized protein